MLWRKENYENLALTGFSGTCGKYDIPVLQPVHIEKIPELIAFNFATSEKNPENKGIHFFIDDYRFKRLWSNPFKYIPLLKKFQCVFSPDFSLYVDYPRALQIYNHWRKHDLGAFWQAEGITVIPTIGWSDKESFDWCFDGEPIGGTVAVSSVGTQKNAESKQRFLDGYFEMMERLEPETIIFYGKVPDECCGNIIQVKAFYEKFEEVKSDGR